MEVVVPKHAKLGEGFSKQEVLASREHPGRNASAGQTAASWISDLVALKKFIILCDFCRTKFNNRKNHYRRFFQPDYTGKTDGYAVNGRCDACKQLTVNVGNGVGTGYIHESTYNKVCEEPSSVRRRVRAARYAKSVWQAVS